MSVAVGGTWVAAQRARTAREQCILCLELGYTGIVPAPATRPVRWADLAAASEDLPLRIPAIRVDPVLEHGPGSLASARADEVLAVRERIGAAAELGRALAAPVLILEAPRVAGREDPGGTDLAADREVTADRYAVVRARLRAQRDRILDAVCRRLHRICRDLPEFRLCLTESADLASASEAEDLADVLADLAAFRLGYWHRPALVWCRAQLGGTGPGEVLEMLSKYLVGSDLADFGSYGLQSVPGSGGVDYGLVAPYMRALHTRLPTVVEVDPACRQDEVRQGRAFLGKFGL